MAGTRDIDDINETIANLHLEEQKSTKEKEINEMAEMTMI